jgi:hypothetical protein
MLQAHEQNEKDGELLEGGAVIRSTETLRSIAESAHKHGRAPVRSEDRISLFWRVFGGTLLSIAALVVITVYQQFTNSLSELRSNLNHLNESRGDLVRADDVNNRLTSVWNSVKELQSANAAVAALKERTVLLEQQVRGGLEERKTLTQEVQLLRERVAVLEGRQGVATGVPRTARDK